MDNIIGSPALSTPPDSWSTNGVDTCTKREFQKIFAFLSYTGQEKPHSPPDSTSHSMTHLHSNSSSLSIPPLATVSQSRVCACHTGCVCSCPLDLLCLMVRPWRKTSAAAGLLLMIRPQHNGDQSSKPDLPKTVAHGSGATSMGSAKGAPYSTFDPGTFAYSTIY